MLMALVRGETTPKYALASGALEVEGDSAALERFSAVFLA